MNKIKLFHGKSHFVPQFLLRNFSANNSNSNQVWYFHFDKSRELTPGVLAPTRSVFAKKGFYEDDTEKYLSQMENESAKIFRKILKNEEPDKAAIELMEKFIFRQFIRSPNAQNDFDQVLTGLYSDAASVSRSIYLSKTREKLGVDLNTLYVLDKPAYDRYDSIRNEKVKKYSHQGQKLFGFHGANNANSSFGQGLASNFLKDNDAVRVIVAESLYFLITDSPCIQIEDLLIGELNIHLPFLLPIAPQYALVLGASRDMNSLPFFMKVNDEMTVKKINEDLVVKAKKGVVSHLQHLPSYIR